MTLINSLNRMTLLLLLGLQSGYAQPAETMDQTFFQPSTTIGGYGELHYNAVWSESGTQTGKLDFHRFVIFLSHSWSERWSLKAELELEHNLVEPPGENGALELEQAYVDYHLSPRFGFQAGVILPSVGFLNQYHEPPLFFGVERPDYSKLIIPTTWFGNGVSIYGELNGIDYRVVIMEGLDGTQISPESGIRSARQMGVKSDATHPLVNLSVDLRQIESLVMGGSITMNEAQDTLAGRSRSNRVMLTELHIDWTPGNFTMRGELGQISYQEEVLVNGVSKAQGFYFDLGYNLGQRAGFRGDLIPWVRYNYNNTAASVTTMASALTDENNETYWQMGLQVKPLPQVVYKVDFGEKSQAGNTDRLLNLGVGYMF